METEQQTPAEAGDQSSDDTEGKPSQSVRVPNVSPNAKSGLDHTIIGSNALADAGEEQEDPAEAQDDGDDGDVPQGDLDAALAWLGEAEDSDTARERADAVWKVYRQGDDPDDSPANADLATRLRAAVYGDPGTVTVPEGLTGEDLDAWVSGDAVEGDETENPERYAAYQARRKAAGLTDDQASDPNATDADES